MALSARCPSCGSGDLHISHYRSVGERIRSIFGKYPVRCHRCNTRFTGKIWRVSAVRYARCPKCYGMELGTWSEQYFRASTWTTLKLRLGATPYRCEFCRCNFSSFRSCKERFSWRKRRAAAAEPHRRSA